MKSLIDKIKTNPTTVDFKEVIATIDETYNFTPTKFINGETINEVGQNSGSCKLFSFAKLQNFSKEETLACFGEYYRKDVLENQNGTDHQNIRNFMKFGWSGIDFDGDALNEK